MLSIKLTRTCWNRRKTVFKKRRRKKKNKKKQRERGRRVPLGLLASAAVLFLHQIAKAIY